MKTFLYIIFLISLVVSNTAEGQTGSPPDSGFTRADTLRGMLLPERKCYDVEFYHLDIRIDPADQSVAGSNTIFFRADSAFNRMQVDLFANMAVDTITLDGGKPLHYEREMNAVHIDISGTLVQSSQHHLRFAYHGKPQVAKNPPWDGGFTWRKDSSGGPWAVVTCQGTGASLWWPNKDHQSDEPDSMLISVAVPKGLEDVSNGRLRGVKELDHGWRRYDWFVGSPINNYDVTVNVGRFAHVAETYRSKLPGAPDTLPIDYYVLPENLKRAKEQFKDVPMMLDAFERYFGKYPFYKDGYKLIESPHNGMEHQSAVAYGNRYVNGYRGYASSAVGLTFDFIIIHESAHEWWGNSITSKDIADMWIHESFGAYAEALFVEYYHGYAEALKYINGKKQNVGNRTPILGRYNVQNEGSGDMYDKGQLFLNTLRSVIDNDSVWFSILRGLQQRYALQTITTDTVVQYITGVTGMQLAPVFRQYLAYPHIPRLEASITKRGEQVTLRYRWKADDSDFAMPVRALTAPGKYEFIHPTTTWQSMQLGDIAPENFGIEQDRFYVDLGLTYRYVDPRKE